MKFVPLIDGAKVVGFSLAPETPTEHSVLEAMLSFGGVELSATRIRSETCAATVHYTLMDGLRVAINPKEV